MSCDWAYVCVAPRRHDATTGAKDLGHQVRSDQAAMSFGNSLGNALSQSCLVYQYWFWCTW